MTTQAKLVAMLDGINQAIGSGVLEVRHADKTTIFRSVAELLMAKAETTRSLAALTAPNRPIPRHTLADFSDDPKGVQ